MAIDDAQTHTMWRCGAWNSEGHSGPEGVCRSNGTHFSSVVVSPATRPPHHSLLFLFICFHIFLFSSLACEHGIREPDNKRHMNTSHHKKTRWLSSVWLDELHQSTHICYIHANSARTHCVETAHTHPRVEKKEINKNEKIKTNLFHCFDIHL